MTFFRIKPFIAGVARQLGIPVPRPAAVVYRIPARIQKDGSIGVERLGDIPCLNM
jgi:hypothetical protein